jgi:hypothetical protein
MDTPKDLSKLFRTLSVKSTNGTTALENVVCFLDIEVASALNLLHPLKISMAKSLKIH